MRSRYSAYALNLADYIIETTHKDTRLGLDKESILLFSNHTHFKDLKILEDSEGFPFAYVTFKAILIQQNKDISFVEKSCFEKIEGKWFYKSGTFPENSSENQGLNA